MRWLIYFIILLITINIMMVAFWRDSQATINISNIIFYLLALPLLIFAITYLGSLTYKKIKQSREEKVENTAEDPNDADANLTHAQPTQTKKYLKIHATALQTSVGDDCQDILNALTNHTTAQLDKVLVNSSGVQILSRRIDIADDEFEQLHLSDKLSPTSLEIPPRFKRIAVILHRLLSDMGPQLQQLAEVMTQVKQWCSQPEFDQLSLHPAWSGQPDEQVPQQIQQSINHMQQWAEHIQVNCFLPESWNEQDIFVKEVISEILQSFGLSPTQFTLNPIFLNDYIRQQDALEQLWAQIKTDDKTMYLVLGADSLIDQDEVDEVIWEKPDYIAAEAGYGLLISAQHVSLPDFEDYSYFLVNPDTDNLSYLNSVDIENNQLIISSLNLVSTPQNVKSLFSHLNQLQIESDQLLFAGVLLENLNAQATGLSFTLSAALARQPDHEQSLFIGNSPAHHFNLFLSKNVFNTGEQS